MKNARTYEKKVRKLLAGVRAAPSSDPQDTDPVSVMVRAVLESDASAKLTDRALDEIRKEFVDVNELRVAPPSEISDCFSEDYPRARRKAEMLVEVLYGIFRRRNAISMEYMAEMAKRDLRRHLRELGLDPYAAAAVTLKTFDGHAVCVDETLVECLKMGKCVHPDSDVADVQGFLERIIQHKDALAAHAFFRRYVEKFAKALAKKRKAEAQAAARAEAKRKKAAEAARLKAQAEAEQKAAIEAKKTAEKKAAEKAKKAAARKAAAKKARKVAAKKAKKKVVKKVTKKATKARKPTRSAKSAKAAAKKIVRKPKRKPASRTRKKTRTR